MLVNGAPVVYLFNLPAFLVCAALAILLVIGVSESAKFNNAIVAIKVTVLVAFILVGGFIILRTCRPTRPTGTRSSRRRRARRASSAGAESCAPPRSSSSPTSASKRSRPPARKPRTRRKDMPFGIIGSLVACTVIYILVSIVMTLIVPYTSLNVPDPVAVAVDAFGPQWAWFAKTIKVGAIIGLTSVILVLMYGQTRIFYTMARDGLLPKVFARVHPKFRTPWINTLVVGLAVASAAGFFDINFLGDATSVGTLAAFGIVCFTVIWLRRTHPDIPRGYRVPLYPVAAGARHRQLLRADLHGREPGADFLRLVCRRRDRALFRLRNAQFASWPRATGRSPTASRPVPRRRAARRQRQADHPAVDSGRQREGGPNGPPFLMRAGRRRAP